MSITFFGYKAQTSKPPLGGAKLRDILAVNFYDIAFTRAPFAHQACHQFILSISGNTGNAQNLTTFGGNRNITKRGGELAMFRTVETIDRENDLALCTGFLAGNILNFGTYHHFG